MIGDLFSENAKLEKVPMQDAEVYFLRYLTLARPADALIHHLIAEVPWRVEELVVWGKIFLQPRLIAWYGDRGSNYTYSGISLDPLPWTEILLDIKGKVETWPEAD